MKDSFGNDWVKIPIKAVSSRAFIKWQCGGSGGMTLNRLAELCGCFSHEQESYGCHHPETSERCLANNCPLAYIDFPENASQEECDRYAERYGDEVRMYLATEKDNEKGNNFGEGGIVREFFWRERLSANGFVEAALQGPAKACTDATPQTVPARP